ncbi:hypothetical protein GGR51DRAFT_5136 [Nemania sp. FL0031]|nr:hypothetical protein GGR51DRAFT_5136 [Nemania sp. FL0031]
MPRSISMRSGFSGLSTCLDTLQGLSTVSTKCNKRKRREIEGGGKGGLVGGAVRLRREMGSTKKKNEYVRAERGIATCRRSKLFFFMQVQLGLLLSAPCMSAQRRRIRTLIFWSICGNAAGEKTKGRKSMYVRGAEFRKQMVFGRIVRLVVTFASSFCCY